MCDVNNHKSYTLVLTAVTQSWKSIGQGPAQDVPFALIICYTAKTFPTL